MYKKREECEHIIGAEYFHYEGYALRWKGEKFTEDTQDSVEFIFCPMCGEKLKEEE